jgi:hypothetical protein
MPLSHRAFGLAAALNLGFVAIEFSAGHWASSSALLADAGHNLIDGLGLLATGAALWLGRLPPTPKFTYGLKTASLARGPRQRRRAGGRRGSCRLRQLPAHFDAPAEHRRCGHGGCVGRRAGQWRLRRHCRRR